MKLATAKPRTPKEGIGPKPNTRITFKAIFKNTEKTVTKFGNKTISKACKNSFNAA